VWFGAAAAACSLAADHARQAWHHAGWRRRCPFRPATGHLEPWLAPFSEIARGFLPRPGPATHVLIAAFAEPLGGDVPASVDGFSSRGEARSMAQRRVTS